MKKIAFLLIPAFMYGCGDACDKAGDSITAKYEECGITIKESDKEAAEAECDDAAAALAECSADCVSAADCGVLDGSNVDYKSKEWTSYLDCSTACVS